MPKVTELFLAAEWRLGPRKQVIRSVFQVDEGRRGMDQGRAREEAMGRERGREGRRSHGEGGVGGPECDSCLPAPGCSSSCSCPHPQPAHSVARIEAAIPIPSVTLA